MSTQATEATATAAVETATPSPTIFDAIRQRIRKGDFGQWPVALTLLVMVVFFEVASGGIFLHSDNLTNLSTQNVVTIPVALGAVMVLLLGEIDLSLAVVAYFASAVLTTQSTINHWAALPSILAALIAGVIIGAVNGFFVAVLRVPSFVVTLAALLFYQGLLQHVLTNGSLRVIDPALLAINNTFVLFPWDVLIPIPILAIVAWVAVRGRTRRSQAGLKVGPLWATLLPVVGAIVAVVVALVIYESYLGVPLMVYLDMGIVLLFWLILRFTASGRHVYAVGGNAEAARRAGISVVGIRVAMFALASLLAAVGGIFEAVYSGPTTQTDNTLLLNAIAVAVIGGVSLFGGRGSAWAVILGTLVIGTLRNGLSLFGSIGPDVNLMLEGAVLIIAVTLDALARRRNPAGAK